MKEITPEQVRAYKWARVTYIDHPIIDLADFARDTTAALMRSEFEREHRTFRPALPIDGVYPMLCHGCDYRSAECDSRHKMTWEQWQAAAEKYCRGEG